MIRPLSFRLGLLLACGLLAATNARAQQPPSPPAKPSGFVDPEGIPPRPPVVDIDPVYRGPAVDTMATIRKRGTLRVGVAASEPMVMHDAKGALVGLSVDLARRLADDLGVGVEFVETSWSRIIPDLVDRQFDVVISGLWITPVRALVVNFSQPTSVEGVHVVASRQLAGAFTTREQFNRPDVRIAVYGGTAQELAARRLFPRATLVIVEGDAVELNDVLDGKAHAAVIPSVAPKALVAGAEDKIFLPLAEPLQTADTAMAVRKGDGDYLNYLNSWLSFQRSTGWLDERNSFWADPARWPQ
ncbi:MAG TPA: transporter substrate-binding domain-containing protein [Vicinamibacterales bacterium]|nr:transporter substrate-binding domain-containing protein [Vicinamibacterales bacterium]